MSAVLLTGATGFLGMEVLSRLLDRDDRDVVCLVRAGDEAAAGERMDGVLAILRPAETVAVARTRVRVIAADLSRPETLPAALPADVDAVVHCAASVSFTLPLAKARQINVQGTRALLALAERSPLLERFVHVSTAFVAGDRSGPCREDELDLGQTHRNTYERSKLEAEALVHASPLQTAVLRPSIVVGDSRTGWTPAFNVIYWPLQAFARGLLRAVPGDPTARVDVVPIDVVADALVELLEGSPRSGAFHAVAGPEAVAAGTLAELAAAAFGAPVPRFVDPGDVPELAEVAGAYLPYFRTRAEFVSGRGGFRAPPLEDYFDVLMDYARRSRWGRTPEPRWAAAELARV